ISVAEEDVDLAVEVPREYEVELVVSVEVGHDERATAGHVAQDRGAECPVAGAHNHGNGLPTGHDDVPDAVALEVAGRRLMHFAARGVAGGSHERRRAAIGTVGERRRDGDEESGRSKSDGPAEGVDGPSPATNHRPNVLRMRAAISARVIVP